MLYQSLLATLVSVASLTSAQVVGSASGAASGVTGGGDATPAAPADIDELVEWLTDATPRVILIDKEFDFIGSEGSKTENGCRPDSNTCGSSGQDALDGPNWCSSSYPTVEVTYDVAGTGYIDVASDKSIVGVGSEGVVRGKGFRVANSAENVIFQNFHITELNPQYIWGGDAIQIRDSDLVWVDHMKFSLIGRQMLVVENGSGGRATISNNEFDGETSWSASCNDQHYWTMMIIGDGDQVTLAGNWLHSTSGRSPKVGAGTTLHAVNNLFENNGGHNFDAEDGATILIEGNVFQDCKAPLSAETLSHSSGIFNVPSSSDASSCSSALGRDCEVNSLSESGEFGSFTDTSAVEAVGTAESVWEAVSASDVSSANAGVGKIGSGSATANSKVVANVVGVEAGSGSSNSTAGSAAPSASASSSEPESSATVSEAPTSTAASTASAAVAAPTESAEDSSGSSSSGETASRWARCGGQGFDGPTTCEEGSSCTVINDYYSQCT